jgi:hypothetical protein
MLASRDLVSQTEMTCRYISVSSFSDSLALRIYFVVIRITSLAEAHWDRFTKIHAFGGNQCIFFKAKSHVIKLDMELSIS